MLARRAETERGQQRVPRTVADADRRREELDPERLPGVLQGGAQQLAPEASAAPLGHDDGAHESCRSGFGWAQEADRAFDAEGALCDQQMRLRTDAVPGEVREQLLRALPERIQHEVRLAAGATAGQRDDGVGILRAKRADRHRNLPGVAGLTRSLPGTVVPRRRAGALRAEAPRRPQPPDFAVL